MKRKAMFLTLMICTTLMIGGCIQTDIVVHVKSDGSGTIEETVLMSKQSVAQMGMMMGQMMGQETDQNASENSFGLFDEAKLKDQAKKMGAGVSYVSGTKIDNDQFQGYKAIFSFKDINKIQIDENPVQKMPADMADAGPGMNTESEMVSFSFQRGNPSKLVIRKPKEDFEKEEVSGQDRPDMDTQGMEGAAEMMKMMFQGLRIAVAIDVDGHIVKTNATHREGNKITLMEMDFDKILSMPEKFEQLSQANPQTLTETMELMKDIPGIRADMNEELVIQFK